MAEYKVRRVDPPGRDALEHGLFGKGGAQKGSTWDNHLYIARQKVGDGWRYFYSQAELRAAQAKQAGQKAASYVGGKAKSVGSRVQRKIATTKNEFNSKRAYKGSIKNYAKVADTHGSSSVQARAAADKVRRTMQDYGQSIADNNSNRYDPYLETDKYNKKTYKNAREIVGKMVGASASAAIGASISVKINSKLKDAKASIDKGKSFIENAIKSAPDKAQSAADKAREAATKAADKAQAAADKAMKAAEKAREIANKALDNAKNVSSDVANKAKDLGDKAADRIEETAKRAQQYGNNAANKAKDLGSDAYNKAKNTATDISNRAQEGLWEARRNVEEFADKAKNFATNKAYRNDKTYREMVNGVSSMKQDLKSVNAYIDELMDNGTTTPEARQELRDNIELRRQIEDSLDYVQNEIDDYEKRNK